MDDEAPVQKRDLVDAHDKPPSTQSIVPMATFVYDVDNDVIEVTPLIQRLWSLPEGIKQARMDDILRHIHPDDRQRIVAVRAEALRKHKHYSFEYRLVREDGEIRYIQAEGQFYYDPQAGAVRNVGAAIDITDHLRTAEALQDVLARDRLTGLVDRGTFADLVLEATRQHDPRPFAIVAFDLCDFCDLNEIHGTAAGDEVLRTLARRFLGISRSGERYARIGGDEFAAILRVSQAEVTDALVTIESTLAEPIAVGEEFVRCKATFGFSCFPSDANDESLIVKASLAMAQAKAPGAQAAKRYHPEMERLIAERRHMETHLHGALERDEFEMYYQPIVDSKTLTLIGAEALLRWNHPTLGVVPPNYFLPAADEAGLMRQVDAWVLHHACADIAELLRARVPLRVGINVTAHVLLSSAFETLLEEALRSSGAPADTIVVEITEQALLADRAQAQGALSLLRRLGVSVALDDFGTGYNTLSYLKIFPIDGIKIDRSFVSDLEQYPYSRSVCSGILALASELGLYVIAEGVETKGQEAFLRAQGSDALQGNLYGQPMPKERFAQLIAASAQRRQAS